MGAMTTETSIDVFPETHITSSWLSAQLGQTVALQRKEPLLAASGYLADIFRVYLAGSNLPDQLVIKTASANPQKRQVADTYNSYHKELLFYQHLAPRLSIRIPRCFFVTDEPVFTVAMEDLGHLQPTNPLEGVSAEQVQTAMEVLAVLHQTQPAAWMPVFSSGFEAAINELPNMAAALEAELGGFPGAQSVVSHYVNNLADLAGCFNQQRQVVSHLDFRLANLRFHQNELFVFDWGEWCLAPRGMDIAAFLVFSLPTEDRRRLEKDALARYAERAAVIDRDSLFDSYCLGMLPAIYLPALMLTSNQEPQIAACYAQRLMAAIEDHCDHLMHLLTRQ